MSERVIGVRKGREAKEESGEEKGAEE